MSFLLVNKLKLTKSDFRSQKLLKMISHILKEPYLNLNIEFDMPQEIIERPELIWTFRIEKFCFLRPKTSKDLLKCEHGMKSKCNVMGQFLIFTNLYNLENMDYELENGATESLGNNLLLKTHYAACRNFCFSPKNTIQIFQPLTKKVKLRLVFDATAPIQMTKLMIFMKFEGFEQNNFTPTFEILKPIKSFKVAVN